MTQLDRLTYELRHFNDCLSSEHTQVRTRGDIFFFLSPYTYSSNAATAGEKKAVVTAQERPALIGGGQQPALLCSGPR